MKRRDDPEVQSNKLSAIKIEDEDVGVSVDEAELVAGLIAALFKDYLCSINTL